MADTAPWVGKREQINMTLGDNAVIAVKQFNSRQGENHRNVKLAFVQNAGENLVPYVLNNVHPEIHVRDAVGKLKVFGQDYVIENAALGWVNLDIPGQVNQAVGQIESGYIEWLNDDTGAVVSSVNILFEVEQSIDATQAESDIYIQQIETTKELALNSLDGLNKQILTCQSILNSLVNSAGDIARIAGDNHFTGSNTFDKDVIIHGNSFDGMDAAISAIQNSLNNGFTDTGWVPMAIDTSLFSGSLSIRKIVVTKPLITLIVVHGQIKNINNMEAYKSYRVCSLPQGITAPSYDYISAAMGGGVAGMATFDDSGNFQISCPGTNSGNYIQIGAPKVY